MSKVQSPVFDWVQAEPKGIAATEFKTLDFGLWTLDFELWTLD